MRTYAEIIAEREQRDRETEERYAAMQRRAVEIYVQIVRARAAGRKTVRIDDLIPLDEESSA